MKTLIPPLAVAILILTLVSCQNDITTQPPPKTGSDTTMILSIDTLTDTVSMPLCVKKTSGSTANASLFIRNDSMYQVMQKAHKRNLECQDFVFTEVDFSRYDLIWMLHSISDNYQNCRYTLIRNDSTKEYVSISEAYRPKANIDYDWGITYRHLYKVPKVRSDYTVKFVFQETIIE